MSKLFWISFFVGIAGLGIAYYGNATSIASVSGVTTNQPNEP